MKMTVNEKNIGFRIKPKVETDTNEEVVPIDKKYNVFIDDNDAWLRVPMQEIFEQKLENKVSKFSKVRGKFVYLNENDVSKFLRKKFPTLSQNDVDECIIERRYTKGFSRIKTYKDYEAMTELEFGEYIKFMQ